MYISASSCYGASPFIGLNPSDSELYKNRGIMALKMQNPDLACVDFTQAWHMGNASVAAMLEQYCHSPKT